MVYGEYAQEEQARYAAELAEVAPGELDRVFFVNSGAEAVEGSRPWNVGATTGARTLD